MKKQTEWQRRTNPMSQTDAEDKGELTLQVWPSVRTSAASESIDERLTIKPSERQSGTNKNVNIYKTN